MDRRLELHALLSAIEGVTKAYFQEPSNTEMVYPCIVYKLDNVLTNHANNRPYRQVNRWQITVIDRDADSQLPGHISRMPTASFQRRFVADGLNHTIYNLHF